MKTAEGTESNKAVEAMQSLVAENLDKVEAQMDSTVDSAKEVVQEVVDASLSRFQGAWERIQNKVYTQIDQHPWIVFAGIFILGYILTRSERQGRSS